MPPFLLATTLVAVIACFLHSFLLLIFRQLRSPLRHLPGPPSPSLFTGNLEEMHDQENNNLIANWVSRYGPNFVYRGFVGGCRLMTTDPVAVAHILGNAYDYPKPDFVRDSLASMVAGHHGLLTVEGDDHKRQRKILTPAFSASHIKSLTPIFWLKASELRDIWLAQIDESEDTDGREHSHTRVDALLWLGRATLDVIGLAGFGYTFNSLKDDTNELSRAFGVIFSTARKFRVMTILQTWFPFLRRFRRNSATMIQAQATMRRIGLELIDEKRQIVADQMTSTRGDANKLYEDGITARLWRDVSVDVAKFSEKENESLRASAPPNKSCNSEISNSKGLEGRDLLSVLIKSNMSCVPSQRMNVEEVLCQISTFLAAGHETTSSALTWCLYALARDPTCQARLREELRSVELESNLQSDTICDSDSRESDLTDRILRCEYLEWVVRESLRVHAPVTNTMRVCMREEDDIPVQTSSTPSSSGDGGPGGYLDAHGTRRWSIPVRKWDIISIPIQAINKSEVLWGKDAGAFRPERWAAPPQEAKAIPGLYSNTLTFLNGNPIGGNRACIGYKFALTEIKIFLYVLLKDIEFSFDSSMVIEKKVKSTTREPNASEYFTGLVVGLGDQVNVQAPTKYLLYAPDSDLIYPVWAPPLERNGFGKSIKSRGRLI